ncbi:MAG: helix-turn-helix transcriptional regulator, partial [Desulfovibrio sp.]|nr:helix-turn-helix transcriptional regulator [Desulfovibrio sp.]
LRRNPFVLPALSMGLLYCASSFAVIVVNLRGGGKTGGDPVALFHFVVALLMGLGIYCTARIQRNARYRLFAALAALTGLFCAAVPVLPGELPLWAFNGRPPVIGISGGIFMPLGLALFFRTAPAGREGFFYGLIMTLGELLWVTLFPLLGGAFANPAPNEQAFHLFTLNCLALGGTGLCLGAALYAHGNRETGGHTPAGEDGIPEACRGTRPALLWIFGAGAGLFLLTGLETGMALPKTALRPGLVGLPYFLPLLFLPLAGRMLDGEKPGGLMLLLVPACLSLPFLGPAQANGPLDPLALFCLLSVTRQTLLLAVLTACARLMKTHNLLPLLLTLAHCLHLMQPVGALSRGLLAAFPNGVFTAALALAAGTAFCLWRVRRLLLEKPELWELPLGKNIASEPDMEKIHAFAAAHDLTKREQELLLGLIRGKGLKDLAQEFGVALSTVRYHQTGILKKTGMPSRPKLLRCFSLWAFQPETPTASHPDQP